MIHTLEKAEKRKGRLKAHQGSLKREKRYFPRWPVNRRVEYRVGDEAVLYRSFTKDLTLCGASFFIHTPMPHHQPVRVKVYISQNDHFELDGQVVWSKISPYTKVVGIIFKEVNQNVQELILSHAFELKEDELFVHGIQRLPRG